MAPSKRTKAGRTYMVDGKRCKDFDAACGRAVALAVQRASSGESVCIETVVRGQVVEGIDVRAAISIDEV